RGAVVVAALDQLALRDTPVGKVVALQGLEQVLIRLLANRRPAIENARGNGFLFLGAAPGDAIDAAVFAVSRHTAPVDDIDRPIRPGDHLTGAKQRIVALQQLELVDILEARSLAPHLVGADRLAPALGVGERAQSRLRV